MNPILSDVLYSVDLSRPNANSFLTYTKALPKMDLPAPLAPLAAWGAITVLGALSGGQRSQLVRVQIKGNDYVARKQKISLPSLRWLLKAQTLARRVGLVVPELITAPSGLMIHEGWTIETFLAGSPARHTDLHRIAPQIAAFHRATRTMPPRPDHPPMSQRRLNLPRNIARTCQSIFPLDAQCAIHGDLHAGNLLRLPNGNLALIDWEECRRDSPLYDYVALVHPAFAPLHTAYEIAAGWHIEPGYTRKLVHRLRQQSGLKGI